MPYYIYKISSFPIRQLQRLEEHASFGAASARAKALRSESGEDGIIKVIFADNELHAEDLLSQVRSAQPNPADD